jgi:uncharacterized OB-fold protein
MPDADSQEYWNGTRLHELRAQRCGSCARFRWPPQGFCPHCYSWEFDWTSLPPTGTVQSYGVVHQAIPAFADEVPFTVARVVIDETSEAVVLTASLTDVGWENVTIGMPVRVVFDDVTPEVTLPRFRPVSPPVPAGA